MTRDDAFLEDILAHPEDDAIRLIYADYLQEGDDPVRAARGEFIRLQCDLARNADSPTREALHRRERELLGQHKPAWLGPLAAWVQDADFARGFVTRVRMEARRFLEVCEQLFRLAPLRHLEIYWSYAPVHDRYQWAQRFAECAQLSRIDTLDLTHNYLGSNGAAALAVSPYLTRLSRLDLSYNHVGDRGLRALLNSPLAARLEELSLSHNDIGPAGVRLIADHFEALHRNHRAARLRSLNLTGNRFGMTGRQVVLGSPVLQRVTEM